MIFRAQPRSGTLQKTHKSNITQEKFRELAQRYSDDSVQLDTSGKPKNCEHLYVCQI